MKFSIVKKVRELDANEKPIQPTKIVADPDFDKVNLAQIGEGADLEAVGTKFGKIGFKGCMSNARIFKDWKEKDSFETVMNEEDIALKAI